MNDSFLEDLELVNIQQEAGNTVQRAERNITRRSQPPATQPSRDQNELNLLIARQNSRPKVPTASDSKVFHRRSVDKKESSKEVRASGSRDPKTEVVNPKAPERRSRHLENKIKSIKPTDQPDMDKAKHDGKDGPRRSPRTAKVSSRSSDGSSKENSCTSDSSKENRCRLEGKQKQTETGSERSRGSADSSSRSKESDEKFKVAMLNSVKEIVSSYTKNESYKILEALQEVYVGSQANLIKWMMQVIEEIGKNAPSRLQMLVEENARLREHLSSLEQEISILKKASQELPNPYP